MVYQINPAYVGYKLVNNGVQSVGHVSSFGACASLALSLGNVSALSYRTVTGECYVSVCADMHVAINSEWMSYVLCK